MDMDFAATCPLVPRPPPLIRFLFIGSCVCSALPSDPISRWQPLRFAILHLHQVGARTFTSPAIEHARHTGFARCARRLTPPLTAAGAPAGQVVRQSLTRLPSGTASHHADCSCSGGWCGSSFSRASGRLSRKVSRGVLPLHQRPWCGRSSLYSLSQRSRSACSCSMLA
jgi:hypothetical protein